MRFWRNERGLSLVEMLVTLALLVIITGALGFFQSAGVRAFDRGKRQADLENNLRYATVAMTRALRPALSVSVTSSGSRLNYTDEQGRSAAFYLDSNLQELRQAVNGATPADQVIAEGVQQATFVVISGPSPLVYMSLTGSQGDFTQSISADVAVRAP